MAENMYLAYYLLSSLILFPALGHIFTTNLSATNEERRMKFIVNLIKENLKNNGWNNIFCMGFWPDLVYREITSLPFTFTVSNIDREDHHIEGVVSYNSNIVIVNCLDFEEFEESLNKIKASPYWHPLGNIIIHFRTIIDDATKAKVFFILWYYNSANAVIIQYDDNNEILFLSHYEPYVYQYYLLPFVYGCWTAMKIGIIINTFQDGFICEQGCHNVSLHSRLRANNLGTCIGFNTHLIHYNKLKSVPHYKFLEPKGKNLHGFPLRAFATEVKPFFVVEEKGNDTYLIQSRDGEMWKAMSEIMNFTIDLSPSKNVMKLPFNFELSIQQIFSLGQRKADLFLIPIYKMDLIIVEMDQTFAISDSGVCLAAHRADFETILFDLNLIQNNYGMLFKFLFSFLGSWLLFSIVYYAEKGHIGLDQIGKDLLNCVRNILLISLIKPPRKDSFRIFLCLSLWSYFILNFAFQAGITSFFTAMKKGKEVDSFEDIIEKGYIIEGMASPDVVLPDTEEIFKQINSKLVPVYNIFTCVERMKNDSNRFCLIDCAVGRYLERNELDYKGQQYIHILKDKIHSHYLNMILPRHSPLTEYFNKHMMAMIEGGLIRKWEQYRYSDIKEEIPVKALAMEDFKSIFQIYFVLLAFSSIFFMIELVLGNSNK